MKNFGLILLSLLITTNAYAVQICIDLSQEEYDAMTVLTSTPEEWVQNAATGRANKVTDQLVLKYSDKQPGKLNAGQKRVIVNGVDLAAERAERRGQ